MSHRLQCTGTLLWHEVEMNARWTAAILHCSDCGEIFITGTPLDDRHHDVTVVRAD